MAPERVLGDFMFNNRPKLLVLDLDANITNNNSGLVQLHDMPTKRDDDEHIPTQVLLQRDLLYDAIKRSENGDRHMSTIEELLDILQRYNNLIKLLSVDLSTTYKTLDDLWSVLDGVSPKINQTHAYNYDALMFLRKLYTKVVSWSIPTKKTLAAILDFLNGDDVLEVGAGRGLWAALLRLSAIKVYATSASIYFAHKDEDYNSTAWTDVDICSAQKAVYKYDTANCLFISWGLYDSEFLQKYSGKKLIVIGEDDGGCTNYIEDGYEGFHLIAYHKIRNWYGINDGLYLYSR